MSAFGFLRSLFKRTFGGPVPPRPAQTTPISHDAPAPRNDLPEDVPVIVNRWRFGFSKHRGYTPGAFGKCHNKPFRQVLQQTLIQHE